MSKVDLKLLMLHPPVGVYVALRAPTPPPSTHSCVRVDETQVVQDHVLRDGGMFSDGLAYEFTTAFKC